MLSRRFSAYSAVESKAFRLREVFGPTGPIQRGTLRWGDRLGSSHTLSHGEVERHVDSGAVFPPLTPIWSVVFLYV